MSNKILFFGNERLGTGVHSPVLALRSLVSEGYKIVGVVIAQNGVGQSRSARKLEIVEVAQEYGIPVFPIVNLNEELDQLLQLGAKIAVLIAYGKIIPQRVIDIFPYGIVNVHPSLLPKHRGPTPIESAILDGDQKTGVSLMKLTAKMDSGAVYSQQELLLQGNESKQELANRLLLLGSDMLLRSLPHILDGTIQPKIQDEHQATYDKLITKNASSLDWNKPAISLEREVRAYAGWPRSRAAINSKEVIITEAHVEKLDNIQAKRWPNNQKPLNQPGTIVETKNSAILSLGFTTSSKALMIDKLIPVGRNEMSARAFLAGYQPF